MQYYELLYIIPAHFADTEIDSVRAKIAGMVEATGAKVTRNETLAKIKLAYPIKHQRHGTYVLVQMEGEPTLVAPLDRQLRLSDDVIRHLITERNPALDKKTYEISAYVPPLSDEARDVRRPMTGAPAASSAPRPAAEAAPVAKAAEVSNMSMADLDKKLDEILDKDVDA